MTEHETLMYQVLGKISESDAPIVFKGALITKLILAEHGFNAIDRRTIDIDANWVDTPPPMEVLVAAVQKSLGELGELFSVVATRQYGEKKSAGISIVDKGTDEEIIEMDISMKPVTGSRIYHYGEISIRGVLTDEILADKLTVLSKHLLFRRAKDLIDVYALTQCVETQTQKIFDVMRQKSAVLGDYTELLTRRADVEHAYGKLKGVEGKPEFDSVYPYLMQFVQPFAKKDQTPRLWNSDRMTWEELSRKIEKPSLLNNLRTASAEMQKQAQFAPKKSKNKNEPEL
jgi:hypothetical protein